MHIHIKTISILLLNNSARLDTITSIHIIGINYAKLFTSTEYFFSNQFHLIT